MQNFQYQFTEQQKNNTSKVSRTKQNLNLGRGKDNDDMEKSMKYQCMTGWLVLY